MMFTQPAPQKKAKTDGRLNASLFVLPLITLVLGYLWGTSFEAIAMLIWIGGGIYAFGLLMQYAYSDSVPPRIKEAALWFLFGDLLVFFIFCLKPV